jgi:hypothetical protein
MNVAQKVRSERRPDAGQIESKRARHTPRALAPT